MMHYSFDMIDLIAALIGSLVVGGLLGLVPLICGLVKKGLAWHLAAFLPVWAAALSWG